MKKHLQRIESEIQKHGGKKEIIKIESKSLKTILKENKVAKVDYLSIDVEGAELEVLKGIDFLEVDVRVISVENNGYDNKPKEYLLNSGYEWIAKCCSDDIFVKK